ncbi:MAG: recombinase family protein [Eubacteriales bacterium]
MNKKVYKAAIYVRLSKEDGGSVESNSITNQKELIRNFVEKKEDITICSERVDDGYSGVDFERPAFMQLMEDVKAKKIDCIIVKDLSRLGRNFIETAKYIDNIFPFLEVRFIAINDGVDSLHTSTAMNQIAVPVKNLMNDAYLSDISIKVRSQLEVKRKMGQFIAAFAMYGYLKDPNNKNQLIVDELVAPVVEEIFKQKLQGMSASSIAEKLNENHILSPLEHKRYMGSHYSSAFQKNATTLWTATAVLRILKNPVYTGTLVQGKVSTPNYKVKKRIHVEEEKWVTVEHTHEALIEKSVFDTVTEILKYDTRVSNGMEVVYPLSGIVICSECGESMIRKNNGSKEKPYFYYICSIHKTKKICKGQRIRVDYLEQAVLVAIKEQIQRVLKVEELIRYLEEVPYQERSIQLKKKRLEEVQKEYEKYQTFPLKAYDDYKSELITYEEYESHKRRYEIKLQTLLEDMERIKQEIEEVALGTTESQQWIAQFKEHGNVESLHRKLVVSLVKKITIYENNRIHIQFRYEEELEWMQGLLQEKEHTSLAVESEVV